MFLYTGGYTKPPQGRAEGIGVYRFDPETGALDHIQTAGNIVNPSYLAAGPGNRNLYAVAESDGEGSVVAYARDEDSGTLRELNRQSSQGAGPCHLSLDHSGAYVLVANYGSGSIAALPIGADGRLEPATGAVQHEGSSVNPDRQTEPHAHMIAPSPGGHFIYATDLGLDQVIGYTLDAGGQLTFAPDAGAPTEPGSGPRHFAFSPDGASVFVINELNSTLTTYACDATSGRLESRQTVATVPEGFTGINWCAHVLVSPDGRFVYGSNRGHDSITIWAVDPRNGDLTFLEHVSSGGQTPRNFTLDPSGSWLLVANQDSDSVIVMRRNPDTGRLFDPVTIAGIPTACCLVFA